jgi:hypothetical protein
MVIGCPAFGVAFKWVIHGLVGEFNEVCTRVLGGIVGGRNLEGGKG